MTESLRQKQSRFALAVALLIQEADKRGYAVTLGDAYRTPGQAVANALSGSGISNSLHCERLAIDLNLFKDGRFLAGTEDHRPLGEWWESLSPDHRWGGRFSRPDGNHYSLSIDGKRG
jgi:hypothetical protein